MLLLLPDVTSDAATARGLGFSVNGQRPSSSNYLLDGTENNNLLVTGPLSAAVPEFIQEYRVSTSDYSAEYGRTSGFVANAITRSAKAAAATAPAAIAAQDTPDCASTIVDAGSFSIRRLPDGRV